MNDEGKKEVAAAPCSAFLLDECIADSSHEPTGQCANCGFKDSEHPPSAIPFEDNKGNVMQLCGKLTIADLVKMGVKEIRLMPEGSALPDNWWRDTDTPNY